MIANRSTQCVDNGDTTIQKLQKPRCVISSSHHIIPKILSRLIVTFQQSNKQQINAKVFKSNQTVEEEYKVRGEIGRKKKKNIANKNKAISKTINAKREL